MATLPTTENEKAYDEHKHLLVPKSSVNNRIERNNIFFHPKANAKKIF
jgi:hypothetical protein